eukprot:7965637-Pyramimonas_sp.AAC.1
MLLYTLPCPLLICPYKSTPGDGARLASNGPEDEGEEGDKEKGEDEEDDKDEDEGEGGGGAATRAWTSAMDRAWFLTLTCGLRSARARFRARWVCLTASYHPRERRGDRPCLGRVGPDPRAAAGAL